MTAHSIQERNVRIAGMGRYLPTQKISGEALDAKLGVPAGTTTRLAGVETRYWVGGETASSMGAMACMAALEDAHIPFEAIDAIVCASGTVEQAIPCTAALIQRALGKEGSGVPCFDLNSTCLSFVVALDLLSCLISSGRYRRVLVVSSEIASVGLDWKALESCSLFGDGAVAMVLTPSEPGERSRIRCAGMATHSSGADSCVIRGGGTRFHPRDHAEQTELFLFAMDGKKVMRQALELLPSFVDEVLGHAGLSLRDIDLVVPHQASAAALELVRRRLHIDPARWLTIVRDFGNMIAASIPMAIYEGVRSGRILRGDTILLLGTSAGFSMGVVVLDY